MARKYPRFLFSNPKNTKGEQGAYVVHLLFPKSIFRVINDGGKIECTLLEVLETEPVAETAINIIQKEAFKWLHFQKDLPW